MNTKLLALLDSRAYLRPEKGPLCLVGYTGDKVELLRVDNASWRRVVIDVERKGLGVLVHTKNVVYDFPEVLFPAHIQWNSVSWKKNATPL